MTHDADTDLSRPRSRRSEATWSAARADYLSGGSAAEVCARHGISLSTFRWRARTEGWRRMDHPAESPFTTLDDDQMARRDEEPPFNAADMARCAWINTGRALRENRLIEARGWVRLHESLARFAEADDQLRRNHNAWSRNHPDWIPTEPPLRPIEDD